MIKKKLYIAGAISLVMLVVIGVLLYFGYNHVMKENGFEQESVSVCVEEERALPLKNSPDGYAWRSSDTDVVQVEAGKVTAKKQGSAVVVASKFLFRFSIDINVLEHEVIPSTCETPSICNHCGKELEPALGHMFTEATCTEASVCERCDMIGEEAFGHNYDEATCETASVCKTCSQVIKPALGHDMLEAGCEEPAKCTRCDYTEGDALGHILSQEQDCETDVICERCNVVIAEAAGHQYKDATCTKPMTCKVCGKTKGKKLGHEYTDATCTQKAKCIRCGKETGSFASHLYVPVEGNRKICAYCGIEDKSYNGGQSSGNTNTNTNTNTGTNANNSAWANRVLELINEERAKEGLGAMVMDAGLVNVATIRANEIIVDFSHTRPDGRSCFTAYAECGVSYRSAGENIAAGQSSPEEVMRQWMNSPGHRSNIMNASFGRVGIGAVTSDAGGYRYYWVQNFAN